MHSLAAALGWRALVLKEFKINPEGGEYVHIVARKAGILAWLFTLMEIDVTAVFRVYANRIEFQRNSMSGQIETILPLCSVSIASCGYMKPFLLLIFAAIFLLAALLFPSSSAIGALIFLGVSLVFFIFYFLNKNLLISVVSNSGRKISFCFKRSVIEGVKIEYGQAQWVTQIINQLIMHEMSK